MKKRKEKGNIKIARGKMCGKPMKPSSQKRADNPLTKLIKKEDSNSHYQEMKMDITCP